MNRFLDHEKYATLIKAAASLSWLYSENDVAYIDSRLIERIFISASSARDLARADRSFDAICGDTAGVGIKTFLGRIKANSGRGANREKVAEFTKLAREGKFANLGGKALATSVSAARNLRVSSDANEHGIQISESFYHCFVRTTVGGVVHEEPYSLIDIEKIRPTNSIGIELDHWPKKTGSVYFTDGLSQYSFSISKNVLFKRFEFDVAKRPIPLTVDKRIFERLPLLFVEQGSAVLTGSDDPATRGGEAPSMSERPGVDFVILPLYSTKYDKKQVPEKSGINQWNAGGRPRTFGEAYIPIPAQIHSLCPGFFPPRDRSFTLRLPTGVHRGKVCQDGSKALMTDPNRALGFWILSVLDPSMSPSDFDKPPQRLRHFDYDDLLAIGKDSVRVTKTASGTSMTLSIEFAEIGAYEDFIEDLGER